MIENSPLPTKLLWIDLEMTGLNPDDDLILEIAAEITDFKFTTLASYEAIVSQPIERILDRMQKNSWWQDYPENRDEFIRKNKHGKSPKQVEEEVVALVEQQFGLEPAVLAGNSIHSDRKFIKRYWPGLDLKLHYRMLDVSAWKVLMQGRYQVEFEKKNSHRAYDDIQASIAELQFYLDWFTKHAEARSGALLET